MARTRQRALVTVVTVIFVGQVNAFHTAPLCSQRTASSVCTTAMLLGEKADYALLERDSVRPERFSDFKRLARGNYGEVFLACSDGEEDPSVVIKNANLGKLNSYDFALAELYMNQKLIRCGKDGHVARFVGHYAEGGILSLVFQNEGKQTLMDALKARNFPANVEGAILGTETGDDARVIRRISSQLFKAIDAVHRQKIVHRDIKGANLLLSEQDAKFKLIDFGVACHLPSKTNYREDLQPHDPSYCPPEAVPAEGGLVLAAGGAFDVFSAGLLVVQMLFPPTRSDQAIKRFKSNLAVCDYDLAQWRESLEGVKEYKRGFELLDAHDGWSLLQGCLRADPRKRITAGKAASSKWCAEGGGFPFFF